MRFDLKMPCKNCPFRMDDTRITFACKERAAEIAEQAYRRGFPCHLSAEYQDDLELGDGLVIDGGFVPRSDGQTQHCAGALAMFINDGNNCSGWPAIDNDEDERDRLAVQLEDALPICFQSEQDFIDANAGRGD